MHIELEIDNIYEDGTRVRTHVAADIEEPPADEDTPEWEDWEYDEIFCHTGTERFAGNDEGLTRTPDAAYFVEVTACDDPSLVGRKFEFGV